MSNRFTVRGLVDDRPSVVSWVDGLLDTEARTYGSEPRTVRSKARHETIPFIAAQLGGQKTMSALDGTSDGHPRDEDRRTVDSERIRARMDRDYVLIVDPPTELDELTAQPFLDRLLELESSCDVAIDLSLVTFCGSAGLRAFVEAHQYFTDGGGSLGLRRPSPELERLLKITRLDSILLRRRR